MEIKTVGVIGCGLMGAGIAQVSAAAGFKTFVLDVNEVIGEVVPLLRRLIGEHIRVGFTARSP